MIIFGGSILWRVTWRFFALSFRVSLELVGYEEEYQQEYCRKNCIEKRGESSLKESCSCGQGV